MIEPFTTGQQLQRRFCQKKKSQPLNDLKRKALSRRSGDKAPMLRPVYAWVVWVNFRSMQRHQKRKRKGLRTSITTSRKCLLRGSRSTGASWRHQHSKLTRQDIIYGLTGSWRVGSAS